MNLFFKIFLFAMLLVSCGDNDPNLLTLRNPGNGPDEFALVTLREIEMPSDFSTLPAPTLGGSNLTDINPQEDVITALGGVLQVTDDNFRNDKFLEEYSKAVLKGWTGLKYSYLEELLLVDTSEVDPEECLEYSDENAEILLKNSSDFDNWVSDQLGDLENFTKSK